MFREASIFNQDLSTWQTQSVTDMRSMFKSAFAFHGDISTWNTSSVTLMRSMFEYSTSFNGDISKFDTSNVEDFGAMFSSALRYVFPGFANRLLFQHTNLLNVIFAYTKIVLTAT